MITILNSKLRIPGVSETVTRDRFHVLLDEISQKKLTTVVAPPGYGKTTLAAQLVQRSNQDFVWYRLGQSDQDLIQFLSYLIAGVKKISSTFGDATLQQLKNQADIRSGWEKTVTTLIDELETTITSQLWFVLEDIHNIHNIQESQEIKQAFEFMIENQPPNIHWIVIGQQEPPFSLSRLRSARDLIEIKMEDLAFTKNETDLLCRGLFGLAVKDEGLRKLRRKTDGWVAALILFCQVVKEKEPFETEAQINALKGSSKVISDYLQENVFADLPEATQTFLLQTSIFNHLQVDFCDRLLNIRHSRELLFQLESNRLFTSILDEAKEWFCYHQLFRDFLTKQLKRKFGLSFVKKLHLQAAEMYEASDNAEEALNHALSAECFDLGCKMLEASINGWHERGQQHLIRLYIERIPQNYLRKYAWLIAEKAYTAMMSLDFNDAIRYGELYLHLNRLKDDEKTQQVLILLSSMYFELGNFSKTESILNPLQDQEIHSVPVKIGLFSNLIYIAATRKETKTVNRAISDLTTFLDKVESNQSVNEAIVCFVQCRKSYIIGEYDKAVSLGKSALEQLKKGGLGNSERIIICHKIISQSLFFTGHFTEGLQIIKRWQNKYKGTGFNSVYPEEGVLIGLAANRIGLGDVEAGVAQAEEGLRYFTAKGIKLWQTTLHWLLSEAHAYLGDLELAEDHINQAIKKNPDNHHRHYYYHMYLFHIYIDLGRYDEVQSFLNPENRQQVSWLEQHEFILLEAHFYWATNKKAMAQRQFQEALSTMNDRKMCLGLLTMKPWVVELMVDIYSHGKETLIVQKSARQPTGPWLKEGLIAASRGSKKLRKAASELMTFLPQATPDALSISLLGKFNVMLGSQTLSDEAWTSQQAKILFKFLAYRRHKGYTPRDILMELFWPGQSPKIAAKRLHVVLSILRKILEPKIHRGVPSSYIIRDGKGYGLILGENGRIDFEEFSNLIEKGKTAKSRKTTLDFFRKAESIYQGDLLAEDPYADWCIQARETLRDDCLFILTWLLDYYEEENNTVVCIEYAEKYLAIDPYAEQIYRQLMTFHQQHGGQPKIAQIFERCKRHLAEGLDCVVSSETETLYNQLRVQLTKQ